MDLVAALLDPQAYPDLTPRVDFIQTHISYIFLTERYVYKVKKPVNFGFLDFTTLKKRHYFLEQELLLNRRLAPEIYLAVLPIVARQGSLKMGGQGHPVEYALQMQRLPQERMMDEVAARGELSPQVMDRLIKRLVPFYQKAATGAKINKYGEVALIAFNHEENFSRTEKFIDGVLPKPAFDDITTYARDFLRQRAPLFTQRIKEGRIRDCHGDLHMKNICLADGIYIFDCIEFNHRFRYGDVAADIDFLAMDLDFHHFKDLSDYFLRRFAQAADDPGIMLMVNFYKCYRAYVRGKINAFAAEEPEMSSQIRETSLHNAHAYFHLAWEYARQGMG
jgi:uncharacterized protein